MGKTEKLLEKLRNQTISAAEARTLLGRLGWVLDRTKGSHEQWINGDKQFTLATHSKDLPKYQMKLILSMIGE